VLDFLRHAREEGASPLDDANVRDTFARMFIEQETQRLFGLRNFWMRNSQVPMGHEGPQLNHWQKGHPHSFARAVQDLLGCYAIVEDPAFVVGLGVVEYQQRNGFVMHHAGGGFNIQATILARRLGLGRTVREEAGRVNI
jgi:hypothetical protein